MMRIIELLKRALAGAWGQWIIRRLWLFILVAILAVFISYNVQTYGLSGRVKKAIEQYKAMEKQALASVQIPSKTIEEMRNKNPFSGAQPEADVPKCLGIFGQCALFGDQWYKTGDMVQDAKIVSVGPSSVKILWKGQEQELIPFDVEVEYRRSQPVGPTASATSQPGQTAVAEGPSQMPPMPPMPMMGGRGGFNPFNMSADELVQMRDRFMNMSPEERRRAFEEMRGRRGR